MKKYLLFVLAGFIVATPAVAYDFGAAGITAALAIGGIVLGAIVGAAPALATVVIGAAIIGITFDQSSTGITPGPVIQAQISPNAVLKTPPGWSGPNSPPSTVQATTKYDTAGRQGETPIASCTAYNSTNYPGQTSSVTLISGDTWSCKHNGFAGPSNTTPILTCPAGYTRDGSICNLTTPTSVPRDVDGVCVIKRSGNSFFADPQDPDCTSVPATVTITPNVISQTNPDGTNKNVTINGDGTVTVTDSRPNTTVNITENNTTIISAPDGSGNTIVTGQGSGATNGTGSANTGSPVPQFDKTGLATESTLGGIKSDTGAIKGDTEAIKNALTGDGVDSSLSAPKSALDTVSATLAGLFEGEGAKDSGLVNDFSFGGVIPSQCGCTPLIMTFRGHTASFDWCAPMAVFKEALGWVLGALTGLYVFSLLRVGS